MDFKCDVCGEPAFGVACSALGPCSFAYCRRCLRNNAEVRSMIEMVVDMVEGPENVADWVWELRYWTGTEYRPARELFPSTV